MSVHLRRFCTPDSRLRGAAGQAPQEPFHNAGRSVVVGALRARCERHHVRKHHIKPGWPSAATSSTPSSSDSADAWRKSPSMRASWGASRHSTVWRSMPTTAPSGPTLCRATSHHDPKAAGIKDAVAFANDLRLSSMSISLKAALSGSPGLGLGGTNGPKLRGHCSRGVKVKRGEFWIGDGVEAGVGSGGQTVIIHVPSFITPLNRLAVVPGRILRPAPKTRLLASPPWLPSPPWLRSHLGPPPRPPRLEIAVTSPCKGGGRHSARCLRWFCASMGPTQPRTSM